MPRPKTQKVYLCLNVTVPVWMTTAQVTREVRTLINEQTFFMEHGPEYQELTIKASKVQRIKI